MQQSSTYKDIIDDKVAEWQSGLTKLEDQVESAPAETKAKMAARFEQLKSAIDRAIDQLHNLDEQETVANTMEIKDQIIKIFGSIDKQFLGGGKTTPFML